MCELYPSIPEPTVDSCFGSVYCCEQLWIQLINMTGKPQWLLATSEEDQRAAQQKLTKAVDARGKELPKEKKQARAPRHVRPRAKLPTGPERSNYELPDWVGDEKFTPMMLVILKALANSQQRLRIMESVVADNFVIPTNLGPVAKAVAMAETYHKNATRDAVNSGAPGPQVFYAFCEALLLVEGSNTKVEKIVLQAILGELRDTDTSTATQFVSVFSVRPCYDPDNHKVVLVSTKQSVRDAFRNLMIKIPEVRHYTAPAPASGQEDEIQKWIEKLESLQG